MRFEIKQYLFEPLTSTKAWFLAYDIKQLIPLYEPRVRVNEVSVSVGNDSCYIIKIKIAVPAVSDKTF
jgi:phage baseplate assembly protein W